MKPGSATFPFFGISLALLSSENAKEMEGEANGVLAISQPWPGMARTIHKDHARFLSTYMNVFPGYYFTGDGARRDKDGYYWITGRVDDVINKAGHRLGTAEIESALVGYEACSEAAVVAVPSEDAKGEAIVAFCTLKNGYAENANVVAGLKEAVKKSIGKIAIPDTIVLTQALPKTRSGKIMRRRTRTASSRRFLLLILMSSVLRQVAQGVSDAKSLGDTSTLAEPHLVDELITKVKQAKSNSPY